MPRDHPIPTLSICIPTFNGARLLKVTLEAVLPQASALAGSVEVVVVDDVSPDDTPRVVEDLRRLGPFRYIRNAGNLGIIRNEIDAVVEHARGEFVWAWNQHCLIRPGAIGRLLGVLSRQSHLDAIYVNFRCARFPDDWPAAAQGGYDGPYDYLANRDCQDRPVERWDDLLDADNALGTQSYAHIARRAIWIQYWRGRTIGTTFSNADTTYPHTCTVAAAMFGKPSYYVGDPVLTIYNGAQTWGDLKSRARVLLRGYPDLMDRYRRLGWTEARLSRPRASGLLAARAVMTELLRERTPDSTRFLTTYLRRYWRRQGTLYTFWQAFLESDCCWPARAATRCAAGLQDAYRYTFYNCRPARWVRARREGRRA